MRRLYASALDACFTLGRILRWRTLQWWALRREASRLRATQLRRRGLRARLARVEKLEAVLATVMAAAFFFGTVWPQAALPFFLLGYVLCVALLLWPFGCRRRR